MSGEKGIEHNGNSIHYNGGYRSGKEATSEERLSEMSTTKLQFPENPTHFDCTQLSTEPESKIVDTGIMIKQMKDEEVSIDTENDHDEEICQRLLPSGCEVENKSECASDSDEHTEQVQSQKMSVEERLERLSLLLQKSQVYADSLLEVIENRKKIERKKALKREKALHKKSMRTGGTDTSTARKRARENDALTSPKSKRSKLDWQAHKMCDDAFFDKIYFPKQTEVIDHLTVKDGVRYFGDRLINASQPALFTGGMLHDYQVKGFQWLKVLFINAINGILADEMGLGKTIQCIALLCHIIKSGFKGPFLVCAPMSVAFNWINELKLFAPSIPTVLYHGSKEERRGLTKHIMRSSEIHGCHPVVITTYELVLRDSMQLSKFDWDYMILDEGHRVKNSECKLLHRLKSIKAGAKLILTGTPLQNNLQELWSLLHFLIPEVFDDLHVFETWFDVSDVDSSKKGGMSLDQEQKFLTTLYEILTPFLLRRVKDDVEIEIPPKSEIVVYTPFSRKQEQFYQASIDKTLRQVVRDKVPQYEAGWNDLSDSILIKERITRGKAANLGLNILSRSPKPSGDADVNVSLNNVMMLLRKCCNHPYLIEYPLVPGTDIFKVDEEIVSSSGKLMVMDQILPELKKKGHRVLIFSQMVKMLDVIEDYLRFRRHSFLRLDGSTQLQERHSNMKQFNSDPDIFIFLLSTRAGGLGVNLTGADTVIIYDSDWNPQNDLQAQDRCHRIGQTQPVIIYRLVTAGSVDQRMVENAAAKRRLEKMVIHKDKFKGNLDIELKTKMKLGKNEILKMLETTDIKCAVDYKKALPEDELARILDRSFLH